MLVRFETQVSAFWNWSKFRPFSFTQQMPRPINASLSLPQSCESLNCTGAGSLLMKFSIVWCRGFTTIPWVGSREENRFWLRLCAAAQYLNPRNLSAGAQSKIGRAETRGKFQRHEHDTGSTEVQGQFFPRWIDASNYMEGPLQGAQKFKSVDFSSNCCWWRKEFHGAPRAGKVWRASFWIHRSHRFFQLVFVGRKGILEQDWKFWRLLLAAGCVFAHVPQTWRKCNGGTGAHLSEHYHFL